MRQRISLVVPEMTEDEKIDALIKEMDEIKIGVWLKDVFERNNISLQYQETVTTNRLTEITDGLKRFEGIITTCS